MESEQTIIYKLENTGNTTALQNLVNGMAGKLQKQFGAAYVVSSGTFTAPDKDWKHEITIRQGNKIGASVDFKWERSSPDVVKIDVDESSKMGNAITYGVLVPFLLAGAYLGYNDMEPLAFLPGKKIAGGLGGLIALIPGIIVMAVLKKILLKNEKEANKRLVNEVKQTING